MGAHGSTIPLVWESSCLKKTFAMKKNVCEPSSPKSIFCPLLDGENLKAVNSSPSLSGTDLSRKWPEAKKVTRLEGRTRNGYEIQNESPKFTYEFSHMSSVIRVSLKTQKTDRKLAHQGATAVACQWCATRLRPRQPCQAGWHATNNLPR